MKFCGALTLFTFLIGSASGVSGWSQKLSSIDDRRPTFETVSIRQIEAFKRFSSPGSTSYISAPHKPCAYSEDRVLCQISLEELVREAYQRKRYEVTGPKWLGEDVFVFQATLTPKTSKDDARLMLRSALEERFGLKAHLESKLLKAYVILACPGGPHLTPADPPDRQKKIAVDGAPASYVTSSAGKFAAVAMRLDDLGPWIERSASLNAPVLNKTGLEGQYKIELHWDPTNDTDSPSTEGDTGIMNALKKQAGLVLRKQDVPVEILVIDEVNRTPTPN
jgi:uncharacterized protein (TIGR03435 family)